MGEHANHRRSAGLLAFLPALALLIVFYAQRPGVTDLWWHLRAGEWIATHVAVPHVDPFSLSRAGQPWTDFEWLYQLGVHALQKAGGLPLVIAAHAALAALGFWAALRACAGRASPSAIALAGALAASVQFVYALARPQAVSLAFLGIYLWLLSEHRRVTLGFAALVVVLQALWVNCHGGYSLGLLLLALWAVERSARPASGPDSRGAEPARAWMLFAAAALASLANPYGVHLLAHGATELSSRYASQHILEWRPTFSLPSSFAAPYAFAAFALVLALSARRSGRPRRRHLWLVAGALALAALRSSRMINLFALAALPALAEAIDPEPGAARRARDQWIAAAGLAVFLVWFTATGRLNALTAGIGRPGWTPDEDRVPAGAVAFLRGVHATGAVFHTYADGAYLVGMAPEWPALVDPRSALFGDAFLAQCDAALTNGEAFAELDEKFAFAWVLLPRETLAERGCTKRLLQRGWRLVYADARDSVLARPQARPDLADRAPALQADVPPVPDAPPPDAFPPITPWRALWRLGPVRDDLSDHGLFALYHLVGNREMARYHLARHLATAPPFSVYYADALRTYRDMSAP